VGDDWTVKRGGGGVWAVEMRDDAVFVINISNSGAPAAQRAAKRSPILI